MDDPWCQRWQTIQEYSGGDTLKNNNRISITPSVILVCLQNLKGHSSPTPCFRRPFELLNEPDSDINNYYKYSELCCYQKVNTQKNDIQ